MDSFSGYGGCSISPDIIEMLKTKNSKIKRPKFKSEVTNDQLRERQLDDWARNILDEIKSRDKV